MLTDRIDVLTQAVNASFMRSYEAAPEPAPIDVAITEVSSKGRVENYPWLYPPPMMHLWKGYRQWAHLGETNYRVPNLTWTAEFEVPYEDLEDDQVDGFKMQGAAMAKNAQDWKGIQSLVNLASGQTVKCFDDSYFFASSHNIGTGNNIITGTASSGDNVTHAMVALVTGNRLVKPLLWQLREAPNFRTDAGDNEANKVRMVRWWSDMRGAAAFGFWWDAVLVKFSSTPTVADMQTTLGSLNKALRTFTLPKSLPTDVKLFPHAQTKFVAANLKIVNSTGIDHILRQALTLSLVGATENAYVGFAEQITSGYLDDVI